MRPPPLLLLVLLSLALSGCAAPGAPDAGPGVPEEPGAGDAPAWPALEDALLRPGDKLRGEEVRPDALSIRGCTVHFVFTSLDGGVYVGAASHCIDGTSVGDALLIGGTVEATVAYCSWGAILGTRECPGRDAITDAQAPNDLALLRVADADRGKVHPAVRHWGGPVALAEGAVASGDVVITYGNSPLRDGGRRDAPDPHDAREGHVDKADEWRIYARFLAPSVHGDSGSPVLTADGRALGVLRTLDAGTNGVVDLRAALEAMEALGGPTVTLATWRQLAEPTLPPVER